MSNDYYNAGSWPATGAAGASAPARAELTSITAGFAKLPTLTANGSKAVVVNSGATALEVTTGTLALAGNFATTGAYNTTLAQQASTTVTLPTTSATMARTDAAQTFTGVQTITNQPILSSLTASRAVFTDGSKGLVSNAITGTGNVVMSADATLTGTTSIALISLAGATVGAWTTPAFSAGDFTASGSMTWTVAAGDVSTYAYTIANKKMVVQFLISDSTVGGTPATVLKIAIPASKTATKEMSGFLRYSDNGTPGIGFCRVAAGGTVIDCFKADSTVNWSASTDNTQLRGEITLEID